MGRAVVRLSFAAYDLLVFAGGLVIDLVAAAIFDLEYRRLVSKGYAPNVPFSVLLTALPATKGGLAAALGFYACLAPFQEETVFRVVPYIVGGLPFAVAATAAWALAHFHNVYTTNAHLGPALKRYATAYLLTLLIPGCYYAYAVSVNPLIPYALHAIHNAAVTVNLYRMAKPPAERKYLKRAEEAGRKVGSAEAPVTKPAAEGSAKRAGPAPARLNRYRLDAYAFAAVPRWAEEWLEAAEGWERLNKGLPRGKNDGG